MRGHAVIGILLVAGILGVALISTPIAEASTSIYIREVRIEDLESTSVTRFGHSANFQYLIYNNNATSTFAVLLYFSKPISGGEGWNIPEERQAFVLKPGEYANVEVEIDAPKDWKGDENIRFEATFLVEDLTENETVEYVIPYKIEIDTSLETWNARSILKALELPEQVDNTWGYFAIMVLFWTIISLTILFVLDPFVKLFTKRTKTEIDDMILEIIRGPIFWLIAGFGFVSSLEIIGVPGIVAYYLELAYELFLIIIITWVVFKLFKDVLIYYGHHVAKRTDTEFDDVLLPVLEKVGAVIIVLGGVIFFLKALGVDITVFVAGLGIAGLVIAFAAQDTLSNFFAGVFMLADRPFSTGDLIVLEDGEVYEVKDVGLRTTVLYRSVSHDFVTFPNSKLANSRVINLMKPDLTYKARVDVGVAYGSDMKKVHDVLMTTVLANPEIMKDKDHYPIVRLMRFSESAVDFAVFFWVGDVHENWRIASNVRQSVHEAFSREGIEIPFPQRDIHIRSGGAHPAEGPEGLGGPSTPPPPPSVR